MTEGDLQGVQFDFYRDIGGKTFRYRLRVLQHQGTAYLVVAWSQRREPEAILADALQRVHLAGSAFRLLSAGDQLTPQLTPQERKTRGLVLNQAGLHHFNAGEYDKAMPLFCAAARANSQETLYARNALQAWRHLERPKEALEFIAVQPASLLTVPAVRAWQAYFQAQAAFTDLALTNYARLFADGYRDDFHFSDYINLLTAQRQYDLALVQVKKYLETWDSISGRLLEADIYRLQRDFPKAISVLKAQHEKAPFNSQIAGALAETTLQGGLAKEALQVSHEMAKANPDSTYAQFLKGRSELALKWYREAKTSFEVAAKLAPANKDIASYLEHVRGLIGEGNNTDIKEPIEMVAVPAALTNSPSAAPEGYAKSYGAYHLRRLVALAWEPGKELRTTDYMLVRVLDASGVSAFSTVQVPFDPLAQQVFVNEVRVMDTSGETISTGNLADYYVLDDRSGTGASHKKVLNIPIPGLQPGCQLAVILTRRELGTAAEFPFLEDFFSRPFPVRDSVLFVRAPARRLRYRASPAREPQQLEDGLCWRVADPLVARWEPLQVPASSRRMLFQGQAGLADVELSDFRVEPLETPYEPLRLHCAYTLKRQFHHSNDRLSGVLRAGIERTYLAADPVDNRLSPFEITIPLQVRSRLSLTVPEGFSAEQPAGSTPRLDPRFAVCESQFRIDGPRVTLDFQCSRPAGKFSPSDYAAYRATMAQALAMLEREVALRADAR